MNEKDLNTVVVTKAETLSREKEKLPVGKKDAWAAEPYRLKEDAHDFFVGREQELKMVSASWIASGLRPPLNPLLIGEPGVGKNRIIYELAQTTGQELFIMQGHEDFTAEDLACAVRFSDESNTKMDYVLSPLVTAMIKGAICFIDEIGKIRPRALALLVSVLDERRCIDSTLLCERIYAHDNFRFVAATNSGEENTLPEFIRSRMRPIIMVGFPTQEEIRQIIELLMAGEENIPDLLLKFWDMWGKDRRSPAPRDVIQLFTLAANIRDYGVHYKKETKGPITPEHLREAYEILLKKGI